MCSPRAFSGKGRNRLVSVALVDLINDIRSKFFFKCFDEDTLSLNEKKVNSNRMEPLKLHLSHVAQVTDSPCTHNEELKDFSKQCRNSAFTIILLRTVINITVF